MAHALSHPSQRRAPGVLALLITLLVTGCEGESNVASPVLSSTERRAMDTSEGGTALDPEADASAATHDGGGPGPASPRAAAPEPVDDEPSALEELAGDYAARIVYQQLQTLDVGFGVGGTLLNTTTAYDLVVIGADGRYVEQACAVEIVSRDGDGSSGLFVTDVALNPTLFERLPPLVRDLVSDGERWELPLASQAIGWRPRGDVDPGDVPLPDALDDPRLVDDDGDGNPGVTTTLSGNIAANGDLYVVQRKQNRVVGVVEDGLLLGEVFDSGAQNVLGGTAAQAEQTLEPAGDASTNRATLVRLAAPLDCDVLLSQRDSLFPPHPVFD